MVGFVEGACLEKYSDSVVCRLCLVTPDSAGAGMSEASCGTVALPVLWGAFFEEQRKVADNEVARAAVGRDAVRAVDGGVTLGVLDSDAVPAELGTRATDV